MLQAKLPNGQYLFPSAQITDSATALALGYDAVVQGPNAKSRVDQGIANVDYVVNDKDRLTGKLLLSKQSDHQSIWRGGGSAGLPAAAASGQRGGLHQQHDHTDVPT